MVGCTLSSKSDINICTRNNKHDFHLITALLNKPVLPSEILGKSLPWFSWLHISPNAILYILTCLNWEKIATYNLNFFIFIQRTSWLVITLFLIARRWNWVGRHLTVSIVEPFFSLDWISMCKFFFLLLHFLSGYNETWCHQVMVMGIWALYLSTHHSLLLIPLLFPSIHKPQKRAETKLIYLRHHQPVIHPSWSLLITHSRCFFFHYLSLFDYSFYLLRLSWFMYFFILIYFKSLQNKLEAYRLPIFVGVSSIHLNMGFVHDIHFCNL